MGNRKDYLVSGLSRYETFDFDRFFKDYRLETVGGVISNGEWRSSAKLIPINPAIKPKGNGAYIMTVIVPKANRDSVDAEACESTLMIRPETLDKEKIRIIYRNYGAKLIIEDDLKLFDSKGNVYNVQPHEENENYQFDVEPEEGMVIRSTEGFINSK